jgi:hypothetical protein
MTATTTATTAAGRSEGLSREILVLAAVVILGMIMTVLDLTVVNVAIPPWPAIWAPRSRPSNG